ncbi:hypothetical protein D3C72_933800 [compost metagenome]
MPTGRTHDAITFFLTPPVFYATWRLTHSWQDAGLASCAFAFAGLMFSGDLDLPSTQYRRWGLLRWLWKPYQWLVPHRSVLSHGVTLGPLVRLAYLTAVVAALTWGVLWWLSTKGIGPGPEEAFAQGWYSASHLKLGAREWELFASVMAGLWVGGASHTLADWGATAWKRRWRRRRRRR